MTDTLIIKYTFVEIPRPNWKRMHPGSPKGIE